MQHGTRTWIPGRQFPVRRRPPDNHPHFRPPRGSGAYAAGAELTEMFRGTEYFSFSGGDFGDGEHRTFDAFIKNLNYNQNCFFRL